MRAAIYARYSSDLQRPTSIEDQVRQCQRIADQKGWAVLSDFVRSDSELSGTTLNQREGINSLIADAQRSPRPFDCLLVDDSSRLGRNLTDVLKISDILKYHGVILYFASQGYGSADRSFRQLLIVNGMHDEQYSVSLAEKVHRGQEGRILKGQVAGGRCYGYKNVPIEDLSRRGEYGRPAVLGVRQEILADEANTIRRMFDLYGSGSSLATIAKKFNSEKIPSPRPRRGRIQAWSPAAVHSMLRNERYRGHVFWNKTRAVRNLEGVKKGQQRPKEDWVIVDVPELRIVSEQQWEKVQEQIRRNREIFGWPRIGGMSRTAHAKDYLFSGLLLCSICGYRMVIVSGQGENARYGCPCHRFKGVCPNRLQILRIHLERQLLKHIVENALRPEMLEYTTAEFLNRVERTSIEFIESQKRAKADLPKLKAELRKLQIEARNLGTAIAEYGIRRSPTLMAQLTFVENRIETIEGQINESQPVPTLISPEKVREFVLGRASELQTILLGDRMAAKEALRTHFRPLVLAPKESPDGPVFTVEGSLDLFSGVPDVMLLAAPRTHHVIPSTKTCRWEP
jgi:DNA invertase Pin-like site-specific DNA recombinase